MTYEYSNPIGGYPQDNNTFCNKQIVTIRDCSGFPQPNTKEDLWNCNLCGNDKTYSQPIVLGDIIKLQFKIDLSIYTDYILQMFDAATDIIIDHGYGGTGYFYSSIITQESGVDSFGNFFANFFIDTTTITAKCVYFKLKLFTCAIADLDPECLDIAKAHGMNVEQSIQYCLDQTCVDFDEVFTEPYQVINCNLINTVVVKGTYPSHDCDGNYYGAFIDSKGAPTISNNYILEFRTYGQVINDNYSIEEKLTQSFNTLNRRVKATRRMGYTLFTWMLPPYVAHQLAIAFSAQYLYIDSVNYMGNKKLDKNNDAGNMWIIKEQLYIDCKLTNFACEG